MNNVFNAVLLTYAIMHADYVNTVMISTGGKIRA